MSDFYQKAMGVRSISDFDKLQQEFEMKKQAAARDDVLAQVSLKKAMEVDVDKLGEQAFMKAAQGLELSPQELAAAQFVDAKSGGFQFNPVTGEGFQKPRISDRIGLGKSMGQQPAGQSGTVDIPGMGSFPAMSAAEFNMDYPAVDVGVPPPPNMGQEPAPVENEFDALYQEALANAQGNPRLIQTIKSDYLKNKMSFTEGQSNAGLYADRMRSAEAVLSNPKISSAGMDVKQVAKDKIPLIGNFLVSDEYQQSDQAKRNFINATLRRESGAVITPPEFANANRQYFPQPGDSEAVLLQKAQNRQEALDGISRAAGPAYKPVQAVDPYARAEQEFKQKTGRGGLPPDKQKRLQELRAKRDAGTLQ